MSGSKVSLILGALAILAAAWMFRWSTPVQKGDGAAFVIDRWTGDMWLFYSSGSGAMKAKVTADFTKEMSPK